MQRTLRLDAAGNAIMDLNLKLTYVTHLLSPKTRILVIPARAGRVIEAISEKGIHVRQSRFPKMPI